MYVVTGLSDAHISPRLLWTDVRHPAKTFYVEIDLGIGKSAKPITGIFCPNGFHPTKQVDLIVYLHGHKKDENKKWYPGLTVDQYWANGTFPHYYFPLREELNASGKNVILVAPTLGTKSESGKLTSEFDAFIDKVLDVLVTYGPYQKAQQPTLGNIILACHSAGGGPMLRIALSHNRYVSNIKECWGFDCLYSGYTKDKIKKLFTQPDRWIRWARSNKAKKLFFYYQSSTKKESEYLRKRKPANICVEESKERNHFWIPITHWKNRLQRATFLLNRLASSRDPLHNILKYHQNQALNR